MANSKVCFIRNNVKGLQLSKKQLKLTGYQKNKIESNGVLFLQETHSVSDYENDWADDLKVQVFFCMIHPTFVGFDFFHDTNLYAKGGSPYLKKGTCSKIN